MFDTLIIVSALNEILEKNPKSLSLYPYGENGKKIEKILEAEYHIKIRYRVDRDVSKWEFGCISIEEYYKCHEDDEILILTIEDDRICRQIQNDVLRVLSAHNVFSIYDYSVSYRNSYRKSIRFRLITENLLPKVKKTEIQCKRIKIRVLFSRLQTVNTIWSFCEACLSDPLFELMFIIGWDIRRECVEFVQKNGIPFSLWTEYVAEEDCPDILVLYMPYDYVTQIKNVRKFAKLIVIINSMLTRNHDSMQVFWDVQNKSFGRFEPDYYIYDSLLYKEISATNEANLYKVLEMGNPKFDGIYTTCEQRTHSGKWRKVEGKRTVLWAPDHGYHFYKIEHTTFDKVAHTIFQYAYEHPELGIIFRPHPEMIHELIQNGYWTNDEMKEIVDYCDKSDNIIYDDSLTYDEAFSVSDAILTDMCCGIAISALPLGKPIALSYRSKYDEAFYPEMRTCYYQIVDGYSDIIDFFSMVGRDEDPLKEIRDGFAKDCIKHFDGKNGYRIKEFIKAEYIKKMGDKRDDIREFSCAGFFCCK